MTPAPLDFSPVRYPDLRPLPNGRRMLLRNDIEYRARLIWRTRRGLITDGASIPSFFAWLVGGPFEGRHRRAALFHDDYYARCARSRNLWRAMVSKRRAVVDHMLFEIAAADGTHPLRCLVIWVGVRIGGWWAWRRHARIRKVNI